MIERDLNSDGMEDLMSNKKIEVKTEEGQNAVLDMALTKTTTHVVLAAGIGLLSGLVTANVLSTNESKALEDANKTIESLKAELSSVAREDGIHQSDVDDAIARGEAKAAELVAEVESLRVELGSRPTKADLERVNERLSELTLSTSRDLAEASANLMTATAEKGHLEHELNEVNSKLSRIVHAVAYTIFEGKGDFIGNTGYDYDDAVRKAEAYVKDGIVDDPKLDAVKQFGLLLLGLDDVKDTPYYVVNATKEKATALVHSMLNESLQNPVTSAFAKYFVDLKSKVEAFVSTQSVRAEGFPIDTVRNGTEKLLGTVSLVSGVVVDDLITLSDDASAVISVNPLVAWAFNQTAGKANKGDVMWAKVSGRLTSALPNNWHFPSSPSSTFPKRTSIRAPNIDVSGYPSALQTHELFPTLVLMKAVQIWASRDVEWFSSIRSNYISSFGLLSEADDDKLSANKEAFLHNLEGQLRMAYYFDVISGERFNVGHIGLGVRALALNSNFTGSVEFVCLGV